ncbi:metallo-beta-lactamase [Burkholderia pseudomallei]|uniref:Metallo-beta-lactamase family protein n=1 Tax=Burkholderia pseudomallei (strain 1106a) TaxID=357348 RepID=A3NVR5_BURP0|nr:metallo-beta-lactamase family protein [Burkholderia pseudomallei 1106a]ALJ70344.1 putative metallo-hydrolase [Burkholderia pseudomallei]EDO84655.1 metallo-beta-lactamase family protein [Burkholderia pseudomallei 406e]EDO92356.1 metallo-beta-lactamase family protein [Burkholderia pseudomallei Pasteur 52237]EDS87658.1 metallo-beta-lactamase family protein [Burkholderia pseudomallei S13]EEC35509.1 metallo-beta-lactamase family protein [Burkholderia pseudomallei 576]EES26003.1 metallo-beta-lac
MTTASTMTVEGFFDPATCTISYLLFDSGSGECALIDSVLDYDPKSGRTRTASADQLIARVAALGARVRWLLETHVHADHLSAAPYLKTRVGGEIAIGRHVTRVQDVFGKLFNAGPAFAHDGSQFDRLLDDGDTLALGALSIRAMHTPGHTPACMTYVVTEAHAAHDARDAAAFVGDTLFMPDYGTARCDFPGGDARSLYRSIRKVLSLPPATRLYMCHDYQPNGRAIQYASTVADELRENVHIREGVTEDDFVAMRTARDATLDMPVLMLPSVQVNMRAGRLPEPEDNGVRYLKIPLDAI